MRTFKITDKRNKKGVETGSTGCTNGKIGASITMKLTPNTERTNSNIKQVSLTPYTHSMFFTLTSHALNFA